MYLLSYRGDDLERLRWDAGLSIEEAGRLFGRSARTWRRWVREGAPSWIVPLLRLWGGDLGARWHAFRGWHVEERRRETGHRYWTLVYRHGRGLETSPERLFGLATLDLAFRYLEAKVRRLEGLHPDCAECLFRYGPSRPVPGWIGQDDLDALGALAAAWLSERLRERSAA